MKKSFMQKTMTALLLAAVMSFGAAGCGKEKEKDDEPAVSAEAGETAPADAEIPEKEPAPALAAAFLTADEPPEIQASAAILIEETTGTILYDKNGMDKMYPASMTKMLTALIAMDYFKPEELITIGQEVNEIPWDSSKAGHNAGETITMENVIRGLMIPSGNDSANVVASAVAKRVQNDQSLSFTQCEQIFTDLMNKKAQELNAVNSHFSNAHGYHDENHYTCAYDMALFSREYMKNPTLAEIAGEKRFSGDGADNMFSENDSMRTQEYTWFNHNMLITDGDYKYEYATGIKTGFTDEAGDCVTASAKKEGESLIAVIFDSQSPGRWDDAKLLIEYGFNGYVRTELSRKGALIEEAVLTKHDKTEGDTVPVVYADTLATYLPPMDEGALSTSVKYNETYAETDEDGTIRLKAPFTKGTEIGTVTFQIDGQTIHESPVVAGRDVSKGTILTNIKAFFQNFAKDIFSVKGLLGILLIAAVIVLIILLIRLIRGRRHRRNRRGGYTFSSSARKSMGGGRRRRY